MKQLWFVILSVCMLCTACRQEEVKTERYGLYYWRTTFDVSQSDQKWMDSVGVSRLYIRLFDVIKNASDRELGMRPEATIRGIRAAKDIRNVEIVPVVFVAPGAITRNDGAKASLIAERLLTRIDAVTEQNGLGKSSEVQIDYDWTQSNAEVYFAVLKAMADQLHKENRTLSTTIRLHQLGMKAPPVDRGALMLYNTGRIQDVNEKNSILTRESVEPYLRNLPNYSLPLVLALPEFSWNIVFRDDQFAFLAPGLPLTDTTAFVRIDSTHWRARAYQSIPITASTTTQAGQRIMPGDVIRREESSESLNRDMLQRMSKLRPEIVKEVIYYKN